MSIYFLTRLLKYYTAGLLSFKGQQELKKGLNALQMEQLLQSCNAPLVHRAASGQYLIYLPRSLRGQTLQVLAGHSPHCLRQVACQPSKGADCLVVNDLEAANRYFFQIKGAACPRPLPLAERLLPVKSTCNFRDLGGYATTDGRTFQWHKVFRSDHLGNLGYRDFLQLQQLGIKTIIDFRGAEEFQKAPVRLPFNCKIKLVKLPITQGDAHQKLKRMVFTGKADSIDGKDFLIQANRFFVSGALQQMQHFFTIAKNPDNYPLVFNCNAGKDRTGFAAALLLLLAGVDRQTALKDYMLSNIYRATVNEDWLRKGSYFMRRDILEHFILVHEDYLQAALQEIEDKFNGLNEYLAAVGLPAEERRQLRQFLVA